jgi:hypothetical protein
MTRGILTCNYWKHRPTLIRAVPSLAFRFPSHDAVVDPILILCNDHNLCYALFNLALQRQQIAMALCNPLMAHGLEGVLFRSSFMLNAVLTQCGLSIY